MFNIKICGLKRFEDIAGINDCRPEFVGFVFAKSKRQISKEEAKKFRKELSLDIKTVGVFVNEHIEEVEALLKEGIINVAQLHGSEDEEYINSLKSKTKCIVIKAIKVSSVKDIIFWENSTADILLLDSEEGGSGKAFSWDVLEELKQCNNFTKPFFIAGGLNEENVSDLLKFEPFGVDISSGVETDGVKDSIKIKKFIEVVRELKIFKDK